MSLSLHFRRVDSKTLMTHIFNDPFGGFRKMDTKSVPQKEPRAIQVLRSNTINN